MRRTAESFQRPSIKVLVEGVKRVKEYPPHGSLPEDMHNKLVVLVDKGLSILKLTNLRRRIV